MHSNLRIRAAVIAALLPLAHPSFAQETRLEEVVVRSTALRENPLEIAQPTEIIGGDELRRQVAASLGETLGGELGISSTYFGPTASQPVIRGLGGYRDPAGAGRRGALDPARHAADRGTGASAA